MEFHNEIFYIILIMGLLIRILPQIIFKIDTVDTYYHLTAAKQIWNERKIPINLNSFLIKGTYSYPPLLHLIISPFVGKQKIFPARFIGIIFDFSSIILLYYVIGQTLGYEVALIASLVYAMTPINIIESFSVTPRPLGWFFLNVFLLTTFFSISNFSILLLMISVSSVIGILLSHKMATQSLFFISLSMGVIFLIIDYQVSFFILSSLTLGIASTMIVSKGFYKKILYGHIVILRYFFRQGNIEGEKKFGNPIQILQRIPWLILFPIVFLFNDFIDFTSQNSFLIIWGMFFLIIPILWKFGDNYRYLVYGIIPLSVIFSEMILKLDYTVLVIIISSLLTLCFFRLAYFFKINKTHRIISKDLLSCFSYVNNNDIQRISIVPASLVYPASFYTNKQILGADPSPEILKGKDYTKISSNPSLLFDTIKKFQIFTFIIDTNDQNALSLKSIIEKSTLLKSTILFSQGRFEVIKLYLNTS